MKRTCPTNVVLDRHAVTDEAVVLYLAVRAHDRALDLHECPTRVWS
jgi:hypothetical protein